MMKRVQKHIDSNVTAADEVLQQSEEVVAKMATKESEVEQATEAKSVNKADEKSKKKKRKHEKNKKSKQSFFQNATYGVEIRFQTETERACCCNRSNGCHICDFCRCD